jgi:hypothetical protein
MVISKRHPVTIPISGHFELSDDRTIVVYYDGRKSDPKKVGDLQVYSLAQDLLEKLSRETPPERSVAELSV